MNSGLDFPVIREQAITLRRAGKSRREIKEILRIGSNQTLTEALKGEPPPEWTRRPNAKDRLRAKARELRAEGLDYEEIAAQLRVSKSSVSLWVRDLPRPPGPSYEERRNRYQGFRERAAEGIRRYWEAERPIREAGRAAARAVAASEIGTLSDRELLIAGTIAYWCEGAKNKPYRRFDRVIFVNSDPFLVRFFLRFLDAAGVGGEELIYRLQIHENADLDAAHRFWRELTGANEAQFRKPTLKRHNPKTTRRNVGSEYHGCLRIEVRRSTELYRKIEGWAEGLLKGIQGASCPPQNVVAAPGEGFEPSLTESKSVVLPG
jgi:transcriptional regulator with XRE-family HTH domain